MIKAPSLSSESSHHHLSRSGCSADRHVLHEGGHDVDRDWEHDCAVVLRGDVVQRLKKIIMIPLANAYQNQQKENPGRNDEISHELQGHQKYQF